MASEEASTGPADVPTLSSTPLAGALPEYVALSVASATAAGAVPSLR